MALGWVIKIIYSLVHNYGVAIILFTIVIKGLLLPLNVKSQRSMRKQQKIQPIIAELQQKYANDQNKLQQEMMKVYRENNVSMSGGCLPMLIQMPILLALYKVIRMPLTYMLQIVPAKFDAASATEIANKVVALKENFTGTISNTTQQLYNALFSNGKLVEGDAIVSGIKNLFNQSQIEISNWAGTGSDWYINFNFLGLDLSKNPIEAFRCFGDVAGNISIILLLIIPVLSALSSVLQSKISMHQSGQDKNKEQNQAQAMSKAMLWMMPVMTGYFALILPAGLGLYWIASGVVQIAQQIGLNTYLEKKGEDVVVKVPAKSNPQHRKKSKKR